MKDVKKIEEEAKRIYEECLDKLQGEIVGTEEFESYKHVFIPFLEIAIKETRKQTIEEVEKFKVRYIDEEHMLNIIREGDIFIIGKDWEELKKKLSKLDEVKE